jgi:hypothetical protein
MVGTVRKSLKASEMALLAVVGSLALCSITFVMFVARLAVVGELTSALAIKSFPILGVMMTVAIGLLSLTRAFDRRNPGLLVSPVLKVAALGRLMITRRDGRS